jgi:hypothetical protein
VHQPRGSAQPRQDEQGRPGQRERGNHTTTLSRAVAGYHCRAAPSARQAAAAIHRFSTRAGPRFTAQLPQAVRRSAHG